jgi:hypothetical protein
MPGSLIASAKVSLPVDGEAVLLSRMGCSLI